MNPLARVVTWLPHIAITVLMLIAMVDMLVGVFLREVLGWSPESLETIRNRRWEDLQGAADAQE